jgi:hypothetical protein
LDFISIKAASEEESEKVDNFVYLGSLPSAQEHLVVRDAQKHESTFIQRHCGVLAFVWYRDFDHRPSASHWQSALMDGYCSIVE